MNSPNDPNDDRLAALIAALPPRRAPDGWRDRVLASIDAGVQPSPTETPTPTPTPAAAPAPGKRAHVPAWLYPALAAAAAVLIFVGLRGPKPRGAEPLAMQVTPASSEAMRGDIEAVVGDEITLPAPPGAEELRVYLGDQLLLRCPGDDRCPTGLRVTFRATEPGTLTAIGYAPALGTPTTTGQKRSADISAAARIDGIQRFEYKPLRIR